MTKYMQKCPRNWKIEVLSLKWAKSQTKAQESSKDDFVQEIWWPIQESGRSALYLGDSWIIQESCMYAMLFVYGGGTNLTPHRNMSKISQLSGAISSLVFNKSLSNLATLLILRGSFRVYWWIFQIHRSESKLKKLCFVIQGAWFGTVTGCWVVNGVIK